MQVPGEVASSASHAGILNSYYGMPSKVYSYVCVRCIGGWCLDEIAEHMQSTHILQRLHILYS